MLPFSSPPRNSTVSSTPIKSSSFSSPQKINSGINKYVNNKKPKGSKKESKIRLAFDYFLFNNKKFKKAINSENIQFDKRTNSVNPNNLIFWDNDYVYKIAPWSSTSNNISIETMGIQNEVKAYTILNNLNNSEKIHTPKMIEFNTINISGKIYALLIITKNEQVSKKTAAYNNNTRGQNSWRFKGENQNKSYIELAREFLAKYGITHNDLYNNVFVIDYKGEKTFFIIDFEKATFDLEKLNIRVKNNLNKLNNIKNIDFGNISTIKKEKKGIFYLLSPFSNTSLFGNSPSSSPKKQPKKIKK